MKDLGRNLKYWGWTLEKIAMTMLVWVLFIFGFMSYMEGGDFKQEIAMMIPNYCSILIFVSAFTNAVNCASNLFPFTITMGGTRKASFTAMQLVQHMILFQVIIFCAVIYYIVQPEALSVLAEFIPTIIGAVLILMTLTNIVSLTTVKAGRIAGVLVYVVIFLVIMVALGITIMSDGVENSTSIATFLEFIKKPYIFLIGAVLDALVIEAFYFTMKKSNLQF